MNFFLSSFAGTLALCRTSEIFMNMSALRSFKFDTSQKRINGMCANETHAAQFITIAIDMHDFGFRATSIFS